MIVFELVVGAGKVGLEKSDIVVVTACYFIGGLADYEGGVQFEMLFFGVQDYALGVGEGVEG